MIKTFKERWNEVDERCPTCNHVTKKIIGLNKQNLKKLFTKPTLQDTIVLIMLIGSLILTWSYYNDISQYKTIINNPDEFCIFYSNNLLLKDTQEININTINLDTLPNQNEYRTPY